MVALRKYIDFKRGTEKETMAKQTVAAKVTRKPGVAGLRTIMQLKIKIELQVGQVVVNKNVERSMMRSPRALLLSLTTPAAVPNNFRQIPV